MSENTKSAASLVTISSEGFSELPPVRRPGSGAGKPFQYNFVEMGPGQKTNPIPVDGDEGKRVARQVSAAVSTAKQWFAKCHMPKTLSIRSSVDETGARTITVYCTACEDGQQVQTRAKTTDE